MQSANGSHPFITHSSMVAHQSIMSYTGHLQSQSSWPTRRIFFPKHDYQPTSKQHSNSAFNSDISVSVINPLHILPPRHIQAMPRKRTYHKLPRDIKCTICFIGTTKNGPLCLHHDSASACIHHHHQVGITVGQHHPGHHTFGTRGL